jgi:integration host factor subunit alpha
MPCKCNKIEYLLDIWNDNWDVKKIKSTRSESKNNEEQSAMALTKAKIVETIQSQNGITKKESSELVESVINIIKTTLEEGDDVMISGFGKFCVKQKQARRGRNPATGQELMLDPRKVVTFKCSGKLRDRINI